VSPLLTLSDGWRLALTASYGGWFISEVWISLRDLRQVRGVRADRGSRLLLAVTIYGGVLLAFAAAGVAYAGAASAIAAAGALPWVAIPGPPEAAVALGCVLIWAGIALRLWSVLTLGRFFRTRVVLQERHELVQAGPYRWLRNPSYTGALVTLAGLGATLGNALSVMLAVLVPLAGFLWRIRVEDTALRGRFGEAYDAYRAHTWALIPFVW